VRRAPLRPPPPPPAPAPAQERGRSARRLPGRAARRARRAAPGSAQARGAASAALGRPWAARQDAQGLVKDLASEHAARALFTPERMAAGFGLWLAGAEHSKHSGSMTILAELGKSTAVLTESLGGGSSW